MEYLLDLSGISNRQQFHEELAAQLQLPDWYGNNLDALYDCLTEYTRRITVVGWEDTEKTLEDYFQSFRRVCMDAMDANPQLDVVFA